MHDDKRIINQKKTAGIGLIEYYTSVQRNKMMLKKERKTRNFQAADQHMYAIPFKNDSIRTA